MPGHLHSIPDLSTAHYSESLRRELCDIAARIVFDSDTEPDYSPDEKGGAARAAKMTAGERAESARHAAIVRWKKQNP